MFEDKHLKREARQRERITQNVEILLNIAVQKLETKIETQMQETLERLLRRQSLADGIQGQVGIDARNYINKKFEALKEQLEEVNAGSRLVTNGNQW